MFVLSFQNGNDDPTRNSFDEYYMALVEIKDFNALVDNKRFFYQPVKKTRKVWNVMKWWPYNRKFIRLFVPSKILYYWHRFIKENKYNYSSTN